MEITQKILKEMFNYNPKTGDVFWEIRPLYHFKNIRSCNSWNTRYFGKKVGTIHKTNSGKFYILTSLFNKKVHLHRVIWLLVYGKWPSNEIDHINGISIDNRINNLRDVTRCENNKSLKISKRNKSGKVGVRKIKNSHKFIAEIGHKSKTKFLGHFNTFEEACEARVTAEINLGYKRINRG